MVAIGIGMIAPTAGGSQSLGLIFGSRNWKEIVNAISKSKLCYGN